VGGGHGGEVLWVRLYVQYDHDLRLMQLWMTWSTTADVRGRGTVGCLWMVPS